MFYFTRNVCIGLVLGLLVGSSRAPAEPLHPLLSTGAVDSLRALLTQSRADTLRVQWLLRLGEDFLNKGEMALTHLDSARQYFTRAQRLSNALRFASSGVFARLLAGSGPDRVPVGRCSGGPRHCRCRAVGFDYQRGRYQLP